MQAGTRYIYRLILTVITLSTGVLVLSSFVFENEMLYSLRGVFVEWTVIIVAFAMLLGVFNIVRVHAQRIQNRQEGMYSLVLLAAFLIVFIPGLLLGPTGALMDSVYRYVLRPLQATLFSLMAFFVLTAAWRAFRIRSAASLLMFIAGVLVLLGSIRIDIGDKWNALSRAGGWWMSVPAMAGARGILLGIALGTIVTGMRLLLGVDRPYSD